jgi:hypothetical protein
VLSRHSIGDRIRDGRLPARQVERQDGNGFVYRVRCEDLRAIAEELAGEVTPAEDARVERMRIESFERRGGEPR